MRRRSFLRRSLRACSDDEQGALRASWQTFAVRRFFVGLYACRGLAGGVFFEKDAGMRIYFHKRYNIIAYVTINDKIIENREKTEGN